MTGKELTEDEAALYDRQIRLWGLEAQQRMQNTKLLIIHLDGITTEAAKNLVLSGVGSVTLLDPRNVDEEDLATQFLFPADAVGKNKAESCLERLGALNPRVTLIVDKQPVDEKTQEFFGTFNLVCATGCSLSQIKKINGYCRNLGVKFLAADMHGYFGFIFCDLLDHSYISEKKQPVEGKKDEVETVTTQNEEKYVSFQQTWEKKWATVPFKKQKRVSAALFCFQVLLQFVEEHGKLPSPGKEEDAKAFFEVKKKRFAEIELDDRVVEEGLLKTFLSGVGAEIAPVSAIMGGFLAQEITKVISGKDLPVSNYFVFDGTTGIGSVETL